MSEIGWMEAGRFTHYAVVDGRAYAIVYWSDGFRGRAARDDEEGWVGSGWFVVFADDPGLQLRIEGGALAPVRPEMGDEELREAIHAAALVASEWIEKRRGQPA